MKKHDAFTLLEVLIALMIIAIALSAAVYTTHQSIRIATRVRNNTLAHFVAMDTLSEMQVGLASVPTSSSTLGQTKMGEQEWKWTAKRIDENAFSTEITVFVDYKHHPITEVTGDVEK